MGFSSWLCSKSNKSIPAYPWAKKPRRMSEIVLVLPDDKTISGVYDGYGNIKDESGHEHDILETLAPYYFKMPSRRADVFKDPNDFENIMKMVKIVRQDKYKGEKYADLKTSPRCPNQGFFY